VPDDLADSFNEAAAFVSSYAFSRAV